MLGQTPSAKDGSPCIYIVSKAPIVTIVLKYQIFTRSFFLLAWLATWQPDLEQCNCCNSTSDLEKMRAVWRTSKQYRDPSRKCSTVHRRTALIHSCGSLKARTFWTWRDDIVPFFASTMLFLRIELRFFLISLRLVLAERQTKWTLESDEDLGHLYRSSVSPEKRDLLAL